MKNYLQPGERLTITATADILSGAPVLVGGMLCVATHDALSGASLVVQTTGVVNLTKLGTDVVAIGDVLYWDGANSRLTKISAVGLFQAGIATKAAGNGVTTVNIRLDGVSRLAV